MVKRLTDRRVLVTGGAGFIGSNLIGSLLESGNMVTCLDNFSTGKRKILRSLQKQSKFTLIRAT
jgi:UDP-N-acetylglucosamine/UDP-N-acetylgalactosamine 4-epimerase